MQITWPTKRSQVNKMQSKFKFIEMFGHTQPYFDMLLVGALGIERPRKLL